MIDFFDMEPLSAEQKAEIAAWEKIANGALKAMTPAERAKGLAIIDLVTGICQSEPQIQPIHAVALLGQMAGGLASVGVLQDQRRGAPGFDFLLGLSLGAFKAGFDKGVAGHDLVRN